MSPAARSRVRLAFQVVGWLAVGTLALTVYGFSWLLVV